MSPAFPTATPPALNMTVLCAEDFLDKLDAPPEFVFPGRLSVSLEREQETYGFAVQPKSTSPSTEKRLAISNTNYPLEAWEDETPIVI